VAQAYPEFPQGQGRQPRVWPEPAEDPHDQPLPEL